MPNGEAPHRINGATEIGKSMPPARPQAATAPPWRVVASTLASAVDPTETTAPVRHCFSSGFAGPGELFALDDLARAEAYEAIGVLRSARLTP
jgi:hypothetical protein